MKTAPNGTAVGNVPVTDPDAGDTHVYTITAGNTGSAFAIDNSGNITVANAAASQFRDHTSYTLTVAGQDQGHRLPIPTTITVNLNDLNDAPVINNATFNIDENSTNGTASAISRHRSRCRRYPRLYNPAGNTGGAFAIDNSGNITVANLGSTRFRNHAGLYPDRAGPRPGGTGLTDTGHHHRQS